MKETYYALLVYSIFAVLLWVFKFAYEKNEIIKPQKQLKSITIKPKWLH